MTVITLTDCPAALRGDLSKWMYEVNTGVYVGQFSLRVREEIWKRVCDNLKNGRATMVFNVNNEQKMDFRVHNAVWEPIDYDGLKLMLHPSAAHMKKRKSTVLKPGFSRLAHIGKARLKQTRRKPEAAEVYAVIDIETTGLSCVSDAIIEIAAVKFEDGKEISSFKTLVKTEHPISSEITGLTGIDRQMLDDNGTELKTALEDFLSFIGELTVVAHNALFDYSFIREACRVCGLPLFANKCVDTLALSKRKVIGVCNYKLTSLAQHFSIDSEKAHRSLQDCILTAKLYEKLKEI